MHLGLLAAQCQEADRAHRLGDAPLGAQAGEGAAARDRDPASTPSGPRCPRRAGTPAWADPIRWRPGTPARYRRHRLGRGRGSRSRTRRSARTHRPGPPPPGIPGRAGRLGRRSTPYRIRRPRHGRSPPPLQPQRTRRRVATQFGGVGQEHPPRSPIARGHGRQASQPLPALPQRSSHVDLELPRVAKSVRVTWHARLGRDRWCGRQHRRLRPAVPLASPSEGRLGLASGMAEVFGQLLVERGLQLQWERGGTWTSSQGSCGRLRVLNGSKATGTELLGNARSDRPDLTCRVDHCFGYIRRLRRSSSGVDAARESGAFSCEFH